MSLNGHERPRLWCRRLQRADRVDTEHHLIITHEARLLLGLPRFGAAEIRQDAAEIRMAGPPWRR
jgi:hypothetical protein